MSTKGFLIQIFLRTLRSSLYPLFVILIAFPARAGDDAGHLRLFVDSELKMQFAVGRFDRRVHTMNRNSFALLADGRVESIIISVPDEDVLFHRISYQSRLNTSTWIGQDSSGETTILITIGDDHLFARIITPDGVFLFKPLVEPFEVVSYRQDQKYETPLVDDAVPVPALSRHSASESSADADDGSRIDMMIFYTNGMAAAHPGSQIDTRMQYLIDQANQSFQNSNINTRFNLVHSAKVAYPDDSPGDKSEALDALTDNTGVFAGVENLRTTHGADQVTLLRQYVDEGCGLAWVLTNDKARYSYAVVHDGSKTDGSGWFCSDLTYVHEVGHNLGCAHDRDNAGLTGRFDYSYGYQDPAQLFRTVMAYDCAGGCPRISYFSNPDVLYNGKPTGVVYTDPLSADNARAINQTRVGMAGYRPEVVGPVINPPPASSILPLPAIMMMLNSP